MSQFNLNFLAKFWNLFSAKNDTTHSDSFHSSCYNNKQKCSHLIKSDRIDQRVFDIEDRIASFSLTSQPNDYIKYNLEKLSQDSKDIIDSFSPKPKVSDQLNKSLLRSKKATFKKRPLSLSESLKLKEAFSNQNFSKELSAFKNFCVSGRDLQSLLPGRWLNDEVINFYMGLLQERSSLRHKNRNGPKQLFFNTFFFTSLSGGDSRRYDFAKVSRWTRRRKVDIFELDKMFVPININNSHWTLAVIDFAAREIRYLDSFRNSFPWAFECLQRYLFDERADKRKTLSIDLKFLHVTVKDLPQQENGHDCGVFVCKAAEFMSDGMEMSYGQKDMPLFRQRIALEILAQKTDSQVFEELFIK